MIKSIRLFFCLFAMLTCIQKSNAQVNSQYDSLTKLKNDSNKILGILKLASSIEYSTPDQSADYAKTALQLSREIKFPVGEAKAVFLLANIAMNSGDYQQSDKLIKISDSFFSALHRPKELGSVYNARGSWYYLQGDSWNASYWLTKSAEVFAKLKDTMREMAVLQNLAACLAVIRNYDKAIAISTKTLAVFAKQNDTMKMMQSLQHLLYCYLESRQLDQAKALIPGLRGMVKVSPSHNFIASDTYNFIGKFYSLSGQPDSAITYYEEGYKHSPHSNYTEAVYHGYLGEAYLDKSNLPKAAIHLTKSAELALAANSKDIFYNVSGKLSRYYAKVNDYKKAWYYEHEHAKLNDSVLNAETRQYSSSLEAVYENNKKENEILRLKTAELEKDITLRKRNIYLYGALVLIGLLALVFALQTRNYKNKKRLLEKDRLLQEEKINSLEKQQQVISLQSMITGQETERNRIAKDLHDGLGGLFSTVKMYFSSLQHERPDLANDERFAKSYELADTASTELRRIAHNLMPEVLMKLGLINAIQDLCNNINVGRLLKISLQSYGMEKRLNTNIEIMLYRIVQELLNNIIKHSQATQVILQFNRHSDHLTITVEDNGKGFNVQDAIDHANAGINTIKSRVDYLNGELNIDSKQGVGTTVMMDFRITNE